MKYLCTFLTLLSVAAFAADPTSGEVSESAPETSWVGGPLISNASATCGGPTNPGCDNFALTITPPILGYDFEVKVVLTSSPVDDYDLEIYDPAGNLVASSGNSAGSEEAVVVTNPVGGVWTVSASPYAVVGAYDAVANFSQLGSSGGNVTGSNVSTFLNYGPPGANGDIAAIYGPASGDEGVGLGAGEPTIGIPVTNNLDLQLTDPNLTRAMYISGLETLRVTFDDSTSPAVAEWLDKSVANHVTTLDPILETDQFSSRTWSSQLAGKTSVMSFSDDDGDTWTPSQGSGINSGVDHQTVGSGPFSANDPLPQLFDSALYYASQDIAVAQLAASHDGGQTFGVANPMYSIAECGGLHGHIQVSLDGTVYVPNKNCGGEQGVAKSLDGGLTWSVHTVPGTQSSSSDPSAATGLDETVYLGMCNNSTSPLVSVSTDKGDTWSSPSNVGAPFGIVNCAFPEMIAGDGDRAAFAFLGSATAGSGTTANPDFEGVWHMYVSFTYDRGVSWETTVVTPGDPVQRGAVCLSGTTCESGRNLLDFNDIEVDEKGRVLIGYADGCVGSCIDGENNSGTDIGRIARQQRGTKGLYVDFDDFMTPPGGGDMPDNPYVTALNFVEVNELEWMEPFNGGSDIVAYNIYRRDEMGDFTVPMDNVPASQLNYSDADNIAGNNYCYKVTAVNGVGESSGVYETCAEAPVIVNACDLPGAVRANDASGDQVGMPGLDVLQLFAAEPFIGDPLDCNTPSEEKLIFTMNIGDATTAVNGNAWIIIWNRNNPIDNGAAQTYDRNMISIRMVGASPVCHVGMITAPSVNQGDDLGSPLDTENCVLKPTGEITVQVDKSLILDRDCNGTNCAIEPANYSLDGLEVRTFVDNVSGQPVSQASSADFATSLSYSFAGNNSCRLDVEPIANPDVGESFTKPLTIAVIDNDTSGDCDMLSVTQVGVGEYGDVSIAPSGTEIIYTPTSQIIGEDVFNYEVTDSSGNTTSASVTVIENEDIIFWNKFED